MNAYRAVVSSKWTLVFYFLVACILAFLVFELSYATFDVSHYAYHPPFGSIVTSCGMMDHNCTGEIDQYGALKVPVIKSAVFAIVYFSVIVAIIYSMRGLLRVSQNCVRIVLVSLANVFQLILAVLLFVLTLPVIWLLGKSLALFLR